MSQACLPWIGTSAGFGLGSNFVCFACAASWRNYKSVPVHHLCMLMTFSSGLHWTVSANVHSSLTNLDINFDQAMRFDKHIYSLSRTPSLKYCQTETHGVTSRAGIDYARVCTISAGQLQLFIYVSQ